MRLELHPGIHVVGEAADGPAALRLPASEIDVVLLDLNLPGMSGLEVCARFGERHVPVVMFSLEDGERTRRSCLAAGAAAFVSKRAAAREVLAALFAANEATVKEGAGE